MRGTVIEVERDAKAGRAAGFRPAAVVRGALEKSRRTFRALRGLMTGRSRRDFVVQFPEERVDHPDAFRGMPVLVEAANGRPRCVGCGRCEDACPTHCIDVLPGGADGVHFPLAFSIDMSRCMFCGLCEEACPEAAIVMSREVEIASYDRASLVFGMEELLVPEALLERRLAFLRAGSERAGCFASDGERLGELVDG